jgi:hypothetical protein
LDHLLSLITVAADGADPRRKRKPEFSGGSARDSRTRESEQAAGFFA